MEGPSLILLEEEILSVSNLNTNDHCLLCLEAGGRAGNFLTTVLNSNPKEIVSFKSLLCYLTGSPHHHNCQQEQQGNDDGCIKCSSSNYQDILKLFGDVHLPQLCMDCYDKLAEMHELHQQLVEIQKGIQEKTEVVRERVVKTTRVMQGDNKTSREKFLESLCSSIMSLQQMSKVSGLILELHERIISKGVSTPTLFPSVINLDKEDKEQGRSVVVHTQNTEEPLLDSLDVLITMDNHLSQDAKSALSATNVSSNTRKQKYNSDYNNDTGSPSVDIGECNFDDFGQSITSVHQVASLSSDTAETVCTIEAQSQTSISTATAGVNVCGVPVDPTANYIMITTNVTDPETGAVTLQPVLVNVTQLQAQVQQTPVSTTTSTSVPPTVPKPSLCPSVRYNKKQPKEHIPIDKSNAYEIYEKELRLQPCEICNERIPKGCHGSKHLGCHIGSEYVTYCKICEYSFISPFRSIDFHTSRHLPCSPDHASIFKCDICEYQADWMHTLRKHLVDHERDLRLSTQYSCPLCPLKFKSKKSVELHLGDKHVFSAKFSGRQTCDICKSYFQFNEIESHLWVHGIQEPLRCRMCMSMFSTLDAMIKHQGYARQKGTHDKVCHLCENITKFMTLTSLRRHYFEVHGQGTQLICELCNSEFLTKETWQAHMERLHGDHTSQNSGDHTSQNSGDYDPASSSSPTEITDICIIDSKDPQQPPHHHQQKKKKKPNSAPAKIIQCPDCVRVKLPSHLFLKHRIEKHNHPPLKCNEPYCESLDTFTSEKDLKLHVASEHKGYTILNKKALGYKCDQRGCGRVFANRTGMQAHRKSHSNERPHQCEQCVCKYKSRSALNVHVMNRHLQVEKKRSHLCSICERGFFTLKMLKNHVLIHSAERPYACQHCGQRFRQEVALRTHERSHVKLGEKFKPKGEMERRIKVKSE